SGSPAWQLADGFYRAGALVFGGGHVVLPLLQAAVVPGGEVSQPARRALARGRAALLERPARPAGGAGRAG
ncbi:chromate transporter, partial [Bordetella pertussis]|uniref:chromate transporter n=1 Tax=Bordetella pertussis TaxID=520 RepID=UPI003879011D